jgi:hypothetical protein
VVFILFLSYICIWLLRADIPSFFTAKIAIRRYPLNGLSMLLLKWSKIVWSKRSWYGHNPTDSSHIMTQRCFMLCTTYTNVWSIICPLEVRRGRMVVEFTTTFAIIAYHHLSWEFEPHSWRGVLDKTLCDKVCQWLATGLWISSIDATSKMK